MIILMIVIMILIILLLLIIMMIVTMNILIMISMNYWFSILCRGRPAISPVLTVACSRCSWATPDVHRQLPMLSRRVETSSPTEASGDSAQKKKQHARLRSGRYQSSPPASNPRERAAAVGLSCTGFTIIWTSHNTTIIIFQLHMQVLNLFQVKFWNVGCWNDC